MCGRYVLSARHEALLRHFAARAGFWPPQADAPVAGEPPAEQTAPAGPRYNVAPSQPVPLIVAGAGQSRLLVTHRWGLQPPWWQPGQPAPANARSETVASKPHFRHAWRLRRALLPATGYYEWRGGTRGPKQPYYIAPTGAATDGLLAIAALWEAPLAPGALPTCTLLTTTPNATIAPWHDRMPVLVAPADWDRWLHTPAAAADALTGLLVPDTTTPLAIRAVSSRVNRVTEEGPALLAPTEAPELFKLLGED